MQQHPRATSIAVAVAGRDGDQLGAALTDTVRLRALLPADPSSPTAVRTSSPDSRGGSRSTTPSRW